MARRRSIEKRRILPDPKFKDELVAKFINCMMIHGRKASSEKAFYGALERIEKGGSSAMGEYKSAVEVFRAAIENAKPVLEVKSRRVGGSNYQVPVEVRPERRQALAIRWLIDYSRTRSGHSMTEKLAAELSDCAQKRGATIKKREDVHKMADANKAFAHYRW